MKSSRIHDLLFPCGAPSCLYAAGAALSILLVTGAGCVMEPMEPMEDEAALHGDDLLFDEDIQAIEQASDIGVAGCQQVGNVSVSTPRAGDYGGTEYWYSSKLTTTGCTSSYTIRAKTSDYAGIQCAKLRVRLFPSSGGSSITPRNYVFVCPYAGWVELANYIIPGTQYRVESDNGAVKVTVEH